MQSSSARGGGDTSTRPSMHPSTGEGSAAPAPSVVWRHLVRAANGASWYVCGHRLAAVTDRGQCDQYSRVSSGQLLIVLGVAVVTLFAVAVLRRAGVPAAVVLVVAGLIIGFLPFVPDVTLRPNVVLLGLLPLLVYDAAVTSSPTAFLRNARSIGVLAVLLVVATAFAVAAVAHWLDHLAWPIAFVLGTAVGPTDASAATSIGRRLGLPRRLLTILEGEALFNDATGLVLYAAAVTAATTGHFSALHTAGAIVYSTL